jgi:hypothetical protein
MTQNKDLRRKTTLLQLSPLGGWRGEYVFYDCLNVPDPLPERWEAGRKKGDAVRARFSFLPVRYANGIARNYQSRDHTGA